MLLAAWHTPNADAATIVLEPEIQGTAPVDFVPSAGFGGSTVASFSAEGIDGPETARATWSTSLSSGIYQLEAWQPLHYGFSYARYFIQQGGHIHEVRLRQADFGNEWVTLSTEVYPGGSVKIWSPNDAGYAGETISASSMRWTPVPSLPAVVERSGPITTIAEPEMYGPEELAVRFVGIGTHGALERVFSRGVGASPVETASWQAPVALGLSEVQVFIPDEHAEALVEYTVHTAAGEVVVPVHQILYNDLWLSLGQFDLRGTGPIVTATDATGEPEQEEAFSGVRIVALGTVSPGDESHETPDDAPSTSSPKVSKPGAHGADPCRPAKTIKRCASHEHPSKTDAEPLVFRRYRVEPNGPLDAYLVKAVRPASRSVRVIARCRPCLFMPRRFVFNEPGSPLTRRSLRRYSARSLVGRYLYRGSVVEVSILERGHTRAALVYKLPGDGQIVRVPKPIRRG